MRTHDDARRWMKEGTALCAGAIAGLGEDHFAEQSPLPGWTRKHLVGHVAANADALGHLVHWAKTGVETPMYGSPEQRTAGIEKGAMLSAAALDSWFSISAEALDEAMDRLTPDQWQREVRTAQGRTVPATEIPWMRAREVMVHAVDLEHGITFADLPADFLTALCADIQAKRGLDALPEEVAGAPLPDVTAWLAGRSHPIAGAPELGPWL